MRAALLALLLAAVAGGGDVDYEKRFVEALRADLAGDGATRTAALVAPEVKHLLSPEVIAPVYAGQRALGKFVSCTRDEETPFASGRPVRFLLVQENGRTFLTCVFDDKGLLTGYWLKPAPPEWDLDEVHRRMERWQGDYAYHRVVLEGDAVREDGRSRGREVFPLGSAFKLYVLAEMAHQVDAKLLDIDAEVVIEERHKSLPSGDLHTLPEGTELPLRDVAAKMISISDNTATDHLIHLLGRENIEGRLALWRNSVPQKNTPFLTTRELFLVKGGGKENQTLGCDFKELVERWRAAPAEDRREMLERLTSPFARAKIEEVIASVGTGYAIRSRVEPGHLEFEWFARPRDMTALLCDARLGRLRGSAVFLRFYATGSEIYPRRGLDYYGFKGGSETGVFVLTSLATKGGRSVALCVCRAGGLEDTHPRDTVAAAAALMRLVLEG